MGRHHPGTGPKLLFAYSAATVPKITVILRKAYGGGYIAMCAKDLGADCTLAWPSAEIAVMGRGGGEIVFHRELLEAENSAAKRQETIQQYRQTFYTPYVAAGYRLVDDIIEPARTRATWRRRWTRFPPNATGVPRRNTG